MRPWAAWDIDPGQLDWSIKQRSAIATWWGPDHDAAIVRNALDWRWMWDLKTSSELTEHPVPDIAAWKETVPESESRRWYGLVLEWVRIRGIELDVRRVVKEPLVKKCLLCGMRMREDSLPYSLVERLGAWDLDFCRPCRERTLWDSFGSNRLGRLQIAAWIRRLVEAVQRIPDKAFPSRVGGHRRIPAWCGPLGMASRSRGGKARDEQAGSRQFEREQAVEAWLFARWADASVEVVTALNRTQDKI